MTSRIKTPADRIAEVGRALYGEHWRMALARGVRVDDDTIRRWMTGRTDLPPDHGVFTDALALLRQRQAEIAAAADDLEEWMAQTSGR